MIRELMKEKSFTMYRLAKESGVPYSTINDICTGKAKLEKCSAETIYKVAKTLKVTMEELLEPYVEERCSFELFKSNVCHRLKAKGDIEFIIEVLESDDIRGYQKKKWYPECFYLLAMLDYISKENNIPICVDYNDLRNGKLSQTIYPSSVVAEAVATEDESVKQRAFEEALPEFKRFNIIESDVRNVV